MWLAIKPLQRQILRASCNMRSLGCAQGICELVHGHPGFLYAPNDDQCIFVHLWISAVYVPYGATLQGTPRAGVLCVRLTAPRSWALVLQDTADFTTYRDASAPLPASVIRKPDLHVSLLAVGSRRTPLDLVSISANELSYLEGPPPLNPSSPSYNPENDLGRWPGCGLSQD